jgi:hypothetical protein
MITDEEIRRLKLETALRGAPRPTKHPDADWMLEYMSWFYETRLYALENK